MPARRRFQFCLFAVLLCGVASLVNQWPWVPLKASDHQGRSYPTFEYDVAEEHELPPPHP